MYNVEKNTSTALGKVGNVPARETEINNALGKLFRIIENCEQSFDSLHDRLQPVMSNNPQNEGNVKEISPEFSSSLAIEIDKAVTILEKLETQMRATRNRIEL